MERRTLQREKVYISDQEVWQPKLLLAIETALRLPCEMLKWLPDPVLAEDGDHFKKYNEVIISHFSEFRRECTCFVIYFT